MNTIVIGGSGSGKSEFAEDLTLKSKNKVYIATMKPFGEDALKRIEKHREQRQNKGFITKEVYDNINNFTLTSYYDFILLECISNLVANFIFSEHYQPAKYNVLNYVEDSLNNLTRYCDNLILVSNDIFCDTLDYDETTLNYMELLGKTNSFICKHFDNVIEVQASNITIHKKGI